MNKNMRNKFSRVLALCCVMAVAVGSFAYFSDREGVFGEDTYKITLDDQGIDIRPVDPDNPVDPTNPDPTPGTTIENIWDMNAEDGSIEAEDVYPGKDIDLSYDLVNGSDAAVDVRETIVLTVKDYKGDALPLTGTVEYRLFKQAVADAYGATDGQDVIADETVVGNTVTYKIAPYTIAGQKEAVDGATTRAQRDFVLVMNKAAKNAFQASSCQIDLLVEAKQHADNGAQYGWAEVANETVVLGGVTISGTGTGAVPVAP